MITAGIATIDGRQESLQDTIASLLPQVDKIHVHCNDYTPDWNIPNVKFTHGQDFGDAAKHLGAVDLTEGIYLACDDDLIYPPDYVAWLKRGLDKFPGCIVGFHGKLLAKGWEQYHRDARGYPCLGTVHDDLSVHVIGTGCMAYDLSIGLDVQDLLDGPKNMSDINVSVQAHTKQIPLFVLGHSEGWIRHTTKIDMQNTIFERVQKTGDKRESDQLRTVGLRSYEITGNAYYPTDCWSRRDAPNSTTTPFAPHYDYIRKHLDGCKTVIDFGPGVGRMFPAYDGLDVTGVDITLQHAETLSKQAEMYGVNFSLHALPERGDIPTDALFDAAVCTLVLLHQPPGHLNHILKELRRVAKKVIVIDFHSQQEITLAPHCFNHRYLDILDGLGFTCTDVKTAADDRDAIYFTYV